MTELDPEMSLVCMARKPLSEKTVAGNVKRWGTGALNIDGTRIPYEDELPVTVQRVKAAKKAVREGRPWKNDDLEKLHGNAKSTRGDPSRREIVKGDHIGRWPANVAHDGTDEATAGMPVVEMLVNHMERVSGAWQGNPGGNAEPMKFSQVQKTYAPASRYFFSPDKLIDLHEESTMKCEIITGCCLDHLPKMAENSVDAIVTDPPYEIGIVGQDWDNAGVAYAPGVWIECLRVLKPGGHLLAFGGTRTYHRLATAIEDVGFEIRECAAFLFGSGFPKSHNVGRVLAGQKTLRENETMFREWLTGTGLTPDALPAGYERFWTGEHITVNTATTENPRLATRANIPTGAVWEKIKSALPNPPPKELDELLSQRHLPSELDKERVFDFLNQQEAKAKSANKESDPEWEGWGTALKPAMELICMARKPLSEKTIAANVKKWGTGALNIDASRVPYEDEKSRSVQRKEAYQTAESKDANRLSPYAVQHGAQLDGPARLEISDGEHAGRWPANVAHDGSEEVEAGMPITKPGHSVYGEKFTQPEGIASPGGAENPDNKKGWNEGYAHLEGAGSASRYFKQADFTETEKREQSGRWPANVAHDGSDEFEAGMPEVMAQQAHREVISGKWQGNPGGNTEKHTKTSAPHAKQSASRYFYCAKASKAEREAGLDRLAKKPTGMSGGAQGAIKKRAEGSGEDAGDRYDENEDIGLNADYRLDGTEIIITIEPCDTNGKDLQNQDRRASLRADMGTLLRKGIDAFATEGASEWSTILSGKYIKEQFQKACKSITGTETSSTIESIILNCLTRCLTSGSIPVARLLTESGGSRAESAEKSNQSAITISVQTESVPGAKDAVLPTLLKISVSAEAREVRGAPIGLNKVIHRNNTHPT